MSKPIKMTEQYMNECRSDFEKALLMTKLADGRLNFSKVFSIEDKKATIFFTGEAWVKMVMLLKEFDKEVAWHGVAQRAEDESKDEYIISDIMVYPQTVTGASVDMDTEKYATWLMENAEDERFNRIRMQSHSHVNMSTSPSSVDLAHQEEILNMLGEDDFYIFMIWNKSFTSTNKVYDLKKNILFEDRDITVKIIGGVENLDDFIKGAKDMVVSKAIVTPTYSGGYYSGAYQGGVTSSPYNPIQPAVKSADSKKKESEKKDKSGKNGKKKKKLDEETIKKAQQQSIFDMYGDDDPYSTYYRGY